MTTLSFEADTCRLRLKTSRLHQDGFVLIAPKRGSVCGIIHCSHLSLEDLTEHRNAFLECVLIASCQHFEYFDPCNYPQSTSILCSWFSYSEIEEPLQIGNVTKVHSRSANPPQSRRPSMQAQASTTSLEAWIWKRRLKGVFWTHNPIAQLLALVGTVILLLIGLLVTITLLIALLAPVTVLLLVLTLLLLLLWLFQAMRRCCRHRQKWYLWDSMVTTRVGKWVDLTIILLPKKLQIVFYKVFSEYPDREAQQDRGGRDVVNIMLVKRRITGGTEVCERLAIGEMSANCWWKSQPTRRHIVLQ